MGKLKRWKRSSALKRDLSLSPSYANDSCAIYLPTESRQPVRHLAYDRRDPFQIRGFEALNLASVCGQQAAWHTPCSNLDL